MLVLGVHIGTALDQQVTYVEVAKLWSDREQSISILVLYIGSEHVALDVWLDNLNLVEFYGSEDSVALKVLQLWLVLFLLFNALLW